MKTIVPFCLLMLIASGESGRQTTWWPKQTTWWPRQTTWWPQQTTWLPPRTGQPTHRWTTRPTRRPTGRQTTRRQNTVPGGELIVMNPACPKGTFYCRKVWNERCYPSFHDHAYVTWQEAQQACVREGEGDPWVWYVPEYIGNLASFHNKEQFDFLNRFIGRTGGPVWIGLNTINRNKWTFSDGSPLNYVPGKTSLGEGNAAALDPASGRLVSRSSSDRLRFVCVQCEHDKEWPKKSIPHISNRNQGIFCGGGMCYGPVHELSKLTFVEAELRCRRDYLAGHLAAFHSREFFEMLMDLTKDDSDGVWLGGFHYVKEEQWVFSDDSPMDYLPNVTRFDGSPTKACTAIVWSRPRFENNMFIRERVLQDVDCSSRMRSICWAAYIGRILEREH